MSQKGFYDKASIVEMLRSTGARQERMFEEARATRHELFANNVILRGVIEITNICTVNCDYCPMRQDNAQEAGRYTMRATEIIDSAKAILASDINVVFLQGGETPQTTTLVGEVIPELVKLFNGKVEILLSLGVKRKPEYRFLKQKGATSYILKHETSDPRLFEKLRHEPLGHRLRAIKCLLELGFKVGTGTIVGLPGQSLESIAEDILLARELNTHMSSASPFMAAPATPLAKYPHGSLNTVLNTIAVQRLVNPGWLIPSVSALEKLESGGQLKGLQAGANVLTMNFTPQIRRQSYQIYGNNRFIAERDHIHNMLEKSDSVPSKSIYVQY